MSQVIDLQYNRQLSTNNIHNAFHAFFPLLLQNILLFHRQDCSENMLINPMLTNKNQILFPNQRVITFHPGFVT